MGASAQLKKRQETREQESRHIEADGPPRLSSLACFWRKKCTHSALLSSFRPNISCLRDQSGERRRSDRLIDFDQQGGPSTPSRSPLRSTESMQRLTFDWTLSFQLTSPLLNTQHSSTFWHTGGATATDASRVELKLLNHFPNDSSACSYG